MVLWFVKKIWLELPHKDILQQDQDVQPVYTFLNQTCIHLSVMDHQCISTHQIDDTLKLLYDLRFTVEVKYNKWNDET